MCAGFIAATALASASFVPSSVHAKADGVQPSLPSALASFLAEEARATMRAALTAIKKKLESFDQSGANPPSSGSARQAARGARRIRDAQRTRDFISSLRLDAAPASSKATH
jgi:hypothetical protein